MHIRMLPGADRNQLITAVTNIHTDAINARGAMGDVVVRLVAYLNWATNAAKQLQRLISQRDIDRFVYTPGYRRCLDFATTSEVYRAQAAANAVLALELDGRVEAFSELASDLQKEVDHWSMQANLYVFDTNVYVRHPVKFGEFNYSELLEHKRGNVHLIIPMAVIDELDKLKMHSEQQVRWRAGHTGGYLAELFGNSSWMPKIQEEELSFQDGGGVIRRPGVSAQLLVDPPEHVRFPRTDDEIVDRAVAVQAMAARPVTIVSYDTGMIFRAQIAGLGHLHLSKEQDAEPDPKPPKRDHGVQRSVRPVTDSSLSS